MKIKPLSIHFALLLFITVRGKGEKCREQREGIFHSLEEKNHPRMPKNVKQQREMSKGI
jgi:hypothetical protein